MIRGYDAILHASKDGPLGKSLASTLRVAVRTHDTELSTWSRLELMGYVTENPAMTEQIVVPEYRSVGGHWTDEYGRALILEDPKLAFLNETRLRFGVLELESFVGASGMIAIRLPEFSEIIRRHLNVEVTIFWITPHAVTQVLAKIRAQLLDRLANRESQVPVSPAPVVESSREDIVDLRPNIFGLGLNINELIRRWRSRSAGRGQ